MGRNIVECIARLGSKVSFISAIGDDSVGKDLIRQLKLLGAVSSQCIVVVYAWNCILTLPIHFQDVSRVHTISNQRTSAYVAVHSTANGGDLSLGIADFDVCSTLSSAPMLRVMTEALTKSCRFVVADTNLSSPTLEHILARAHDTSTPVYIPIAMPISTSMSDDSSSLWQMD